MPDDDRRLSEALAALPRVTASTGFRDRVMRRIAAERQFAAPSRRRPLGRLPLGRLPLAIAALLVLTLSTLVAQELRHRAAERHAAAEIAALEAEYQALARDLAALERRAAAARPLVHLGGDENVELVLDVASFARRPRAVPAAGPGPRPPRPRPVY